MNSVFFLVTASILFCPVWSGKFSSGGEFEWYLSEMDGAKCEKKTKQQQQQQCPLNYSNNRKFIGSTPVNLTTITTFSHYYYRSFYIL